MFISQQLQSAQALLAQKLELPAREARIEAQSLLSHILGDVSRAWLITHENDTLTVEQHMHLKQLLQRRLAGEPIAYIVGAREFYGLQFKVTPDVLIPRPDTETIVEAALERIPAQQSCSVLDLGTGSGAIAISIAHHRPHAEIVAVDASDGALAIARENTQRLNTPNVQLLRSDWFSALKDEKFDMIVCNPPYIAELDPHLADLNFEPMSALISGFDGLDDIRAIISQAAQHLNAKGWLLLEHGYDQAKPVAEILRESGFSEVESVPDLSGVLRVTLGKSNSNLKT